MPKKRLADYHRKRDFTRTPEPAGRAVPPASDKPRFVVQRHRARRLHYDLRFEIDGVLVSWAVPKGPTLDPEAKRMAVHVEDHPIEYLDFEGVIPSGEYGGGDVIVWDIGTWEPHATDDPVHAVANGDFHADMYGDKLKGRLILVRRGGDEKQWLLLHKHDDHAVEGWDPEDYPRSVLSGRTNDEVKQDPERLWRSDLPAARAAITVRTPGPTDEDLDALDDLGDAGTWHIFGHDVRLTNLDRELFPARKGESAVTRRELIAYAARIAPTVMGYLSGRPLILHRFPKGAAADGTWQRRLPARAPDWLPRWEDHDTTYLVADDAVTLVWAANLGALEWHTWTSTAEHPDHPTYVGLQIEPTQDDAWDDVRTMAGVCRTAFDHLGIAGFPKLSGHTGIEIWVPLDPGTGFEETRGWAQHLIDTIGRLQTNLDVRLKDAGTTVAAPYSPLPYAGAPVSTPIGWDELDNAELRADTYTIRNVLDRLAERDDPFRPILHTHQTLPDFR